MVPGLRYSRPGARVRLRNQFQNGVIVAGTPDERVDYKIVKRSSLWDKTVGLYKYGNDYYGQCGSTDIDGFVRLYYKAETIIKGNTEQYKDAYGMYKVNGKTYLYMQTCDSRVLVILVRIF